MTACLDEYRTWSTDPYFDEATRQELAGIGSDPGEIQERFYRRLTFGTGGLRGILGAGTNRMNDFTVALATEGFARYLDSLGDDARRRGVVISHDSRRHSDRFALVAALVFATHGIRVRLTDRLRPTPMLSFAVRHYGAAGGVMVTASHNPAQYNGYKAYGPDGGQMPPEAADRVLAHMDAIGDVREVRWISEAEARNSGLLETLGTEWDEAYLDMLLALRIDREAAHRHPDLSIVYTPLHGAGNRPVRDILARCGFRRVHTVPEQEAPDPDFSTVVSPNPEERAALELAIRLAGDVGADLVIATDPDGDRTGLAVRDRNGQFFVLTGNQIGLLLMEYILSSHQEQGTMPANAFCVTTIVSSRLSRRIARAYGVALHEVLTGFKFIGEVIQSLDEEGDGHFLFGFEESYGYLAGTDVRDKDAVVAAMLIAEMAARCADRGETLHDRLRSLFARFGFAAEETVSLTLEGMDGVRRIQEAMGRLRARPAGDLAGIPVVARSDYLAGLRVEPGTGIVAPLALPQSDVLLYETGDLDWCCVRPSGTEPKLKIYFGAYDRDESAARSRLAEVRDRLTALIRSLL